MADQDTTKRVSDETQVATGRTRRRGNTKKASGKRKEDTVVLDTVMQTDPRMEFTAEDFERFGNLEGEGGNAYGIELPGGTAPQPADSSQEQTVYLTAAQRQQMAERNARAAAAAASSGSSSAAVSNRSSARAASRAASHAAAASSGVSGTEESAVQSVRHRQEQRSWEDAQEEILNEENHRRQEAVSEKYFPNGLLQENPRREEGVRRYRRHRIGVLDFICLLIGIAVLYVGMRIFGSTGGMALIWAFFDGDAGLLLEHAKDLLYFAENPDLAWTFYYEIVAMVLLLMMLAVVIIVIHCFLKNQMLGIIKGILLWVTGAGMTFLGISYCVYYLVTMGADVIAANLGTSVLRSLLSASAMMTFAGLAAAAAVLVWLLYMLIWGLISCFTRFGGLTLTFLLLVATLSLALLVLHLYLAYQSGTGIVEDDVLYAFFRTPVLLMSFMLLSVCAAVEDFLAKRKRRR